MNKSQCFAQKLFKLSIRYIVYNMNLLHLYNLLLILFESPYHHKLRRGFTFCSFCSCSIIKKNQFHLIVNWNVSNKTKKMNKEINNNSNNVQKWLLFNLRWFRNFNLAIQYAFYETTINFTERQTKQMYKYMMRISKRNEFIFFIQNVQYHTRVIQ